MKLERDQRDTKPPRAVAAHEWSTFPELAGTHLRWRRSERKTWDLVASNGARWASVLPPFGYRSLPIPGVIVVSGRRSDVRRVGKARDKTTELVAENTGTPVLRQVGVHFDHKAGARLEVPELVDLSPFVFPVNSRRRRQAVMSAVDRNGRTVVSYRLNLPRFALSNVAVGTSIEVVVDPGVDATSWMPLFVAATSGLLPRYFQAPGGGG